MRKDSVKNNKYAKVPSMFKTAFKVTVKMPHLPFYQLAVASLRPFDSRGFNVSFCFIATDYISNLINEK